MLLIFFNHCYLKSIQDLFRFVDRNHEAVFMIEIPNELKMSMRGLTYYFKASKIIIANCFV